MGLNRETPSLGGYRKKTTFRDGQRRLLDALYVDGGGVQTLAEEYGCTSQNLSNWRLRGGVPFKHLKGFAEVLQVSTWALNYEGIAALDACDPPSWEEVVHSCELDRDVEEYILRGTFPKI